MTKSIDLTPTWTALLPVFFAALENGTETGKRLAREELQRMAEAADLWNGAASKDFFTAHDVYFFSDAFPGMPERQSLGDSPYAISLTVSRTVGFSIYNGDGSSAKCCAGACYAGLSRIWIGETLVFENVPQP